MLRIISLRLSLLCCLISLSGCAWNFASDKPTYITNANGMYMYYPDGAYYYLAYPNNAVVIGSPPYCASHPYYVPTRGCFKMHNRNYRIYRRPHLPRYPSPCSYSTPQRHCVSCVR